MRRLGLDVGRARVGVAISDPLGMTAQPLGQVPAGQKDLADLKALIADYDIDKVVVGKPLNRFGEPTEQTKWIENWVENLEQQLNCTVVYWDERHSTKAVESVLIQADVSRKKRKTVIDQQAAVFILQGYMDRVGKD